jgi:hypothetical protein
MNNDTSKIGSNDFRDDSSSCCNANRVTQQFYAELHSFESGSSEWTEFIHREMDGTNVFVQILCFQEISTTGDKRWLEALFSRSESETNATVLSAIYNAISQLGGFKSLADYETLFETSDISRRSAAMIVLYSMRPEDAIKILLRLLRTDPELQRTAAERLAYFESDAGQQELLDSLGDQDFHNRVSATCALCVLGNAVGINHVRSLLAEEATLPSLERTNLAFALDRMLEHCDVEYDRPGTIGGLPQRPPSDWAKSILKKASEWIEAKSSELTFK